MNKTGSLRMEQPVYPQFGGWEVIITKVVAIGGGLWAIWKGAAYGFQQIRKAWRVVVQFAGALDVLEKLSADAAIVRARQKLMIETSPQPFFRTDAQGRCVEANAAYLKMLGLPLSEVVGAGWETALHPADQVAVVQAWNEAVREAAQFNRQFRMRTSDGYTLKVSIRAFPVIDPQGRVVEFHGVATVLSRKPATQDE